MATWQEKLGSNLLTFALSMGIFVIVSIVGSVIAHWNAPTPPEPLPTIDLPDEVKGELNYVEGLSTTASGEAYMGKIFLTDPIEKDQSTAVIWTRLTKEGLTGFIPNQKRARETTFSKYLVNCSRSTIQEISSARYMLILGSAGTGIGSAKRESPTPSPTPSFGNVADASNKSGQELAPPKKSLLRNVIDRTCKQVLAQ